ncbi:hypothetical protein JW916_10390 [Candidatus Sumerlaeota bacterium]|nr:hypothetical protein [Candidatus Sumerlaeota bacterium]
MTETSKYLELDNLEARLDGEIVHLQRQKTINLIIGAVLMVIIFGYFYFMSGKVKELVEPQEIAAMASERVVSYLPDARATVEETARREVPILVDKMITKLLTESVPEAHARLKTLILSGADKAMDDAETVFFNQVNQHLRTHGATIRSLSADLTTDGDTKAFEEALYKTLEESAQDPSVEVDLLGYGVALENLDGTLMYLAQENISLTPEEESARDLIAVLRELMNRARQ